MELDLEPSGLVIKHDDDGEVERVEPAVLAEKVSSRVLLCFAVQQTCCFATLARTNGSVSVKIENRRPRPRESQLVKSSVVR